MARRPVWIPLDEQFLALPQGALEDGRLKPVDLAVFAHLCDYADYETGLAFPSRKTLKDRVGCSEGQVFVSTRRLEEFGYIKIDPSPGRQATKYWIQPVTLRMVEESQPVTLKTVGTAQPVRDDLPTRQSLNGDQAHNPSPTDDELEELDTNKKRSSNGSNPSPKQFVEDLKAKGVLKRRTSRRKEPIYTDADYGRGWPTQADG